MNISQKRPIDEVVQGITETWKVLATCKSTMYEKCVIMVIHLAKQGVWCMV